MGTGIIQVNEMLKPGGIYDLPPLYVYNTGDESANYEVDVAYQNDVPQKRPAKEWFSFEPKTFHLDPQGTQTVNIILNLPVKVEPGEYFCYAEGRPIDKTVVQGGAKIGVAAAAKVYFTIAPASIWQALYYKAIYLWKHYSPWTYVISAILVLTVLVVLFRRFFSFNIGIGRKRNNPDFAENDENNKDYWLKVALKKVEKYTAKLSEHEVETAFSEAKRNSESVKRLLYSDDKSILKNASPNLKKILILSRKGLRKVKKKNPDYYEELVNIVVSGLI